MTEKERETRRACINMAWVDVELEEVEPQLQTAKKDIEFLYEENMHLRQMLKEALEREWWHDDTGVDLAKYLELEMSIP